MKTILDKQLVRLGLGVVAAALSICAHAGDLPDPALTPGAINSDVTQDNIHNTVCVRGWTKTVRPPSFYTTRLKGTGLGLAISYGIVERHGGRIEVRSQVGNGSIFTIFLPASS